MDVLYTLMMMLVSAGACTVNQFHAHGQRVDVVTCPILIDEPDAAEAPAPDATEDKGGRIGTERPLRRAYVGPGFVGPGFVRPSAPASGPVVLLQRR